MAPARRPSDGLLARVNFPLFAIDMLTSRHVVVSGGGGSSKTGVANGFEIYEISHNGRHFCAQEITRHETGGNVVMNFAIHNEGRRAYLCAGQESHCQMYIVNPRITNAQGEDVISEKYYSDKYLGSENGLRSRVGRPLDANDGNDDDDDGNRKPNGHVDFDNNESGHKETKTNRKNSAEKSSNDDDLFRVLKFDVKSADSVQTDFLQTEPLQRVIRISGNGSLMATGGTDGYLRIWSFPQMLQTLTVKAHSMEIDDLDISPDSKHIVSIAKDGLAIIWELSTGNKVCELQWPASKGTAKYLFKRCRYGTVESQKDQHRLFSISNPLGKVGKQKGFLQQWDSSTGKLRLAVDMEESLAALTVRDDGRFVAIGTMFSGSVSMYIAFSLQCVLNVPNAHSMFVTGLQFLPVTNQEGPPISSDSEAAVLSISVDNKICIHSLQQRHAMPAWLAIILIIMVILGSFTVCSYLGL